MIYRWLQAYFLAFSIALGRPRSRKVYSVIS